MDHVPFARWYEEENITKLQKKNLAFPIDPAAPAQAPAQGALSRQRAHADLSPPALDSEASELPFSMEIKSCVFSTFYKNYRLTFSFHWPSRSTSWQAPSCCVPSGRRPRFRQGPGPGCCTEGAEDGDIRVAVFVMLPLAWNQT